jgi:hypothetical protein
MARIQSIDFVDIQEKCNPLVDIRPQVLDVYFSYLIEYKEKDAKNKEIKDPNIEPQSFSENELWEFKNKKPGESLKELIKGKVESLDELYKMNGNPSKMIKVSVDLYISDNGLALLEYDFSDKSSDTKQAYIPAEMIDEAKENNLNEKIKYIELYKKRFEDKSLQNEMNALLLAREENKYLQSEIDELDKQINACYELNSNGNELLLKKSENRLKMDFNEIAIVNHRKVIIAKYIKEQALRLNALKQKDKLKYAVGKLKSTINGKQYLMRNVDIGHKTDTMILGETIYLVLETIGVPDNTEFTIKIKQRNENGPIAKNEAFTFLDENEDTDTLKIKVGKYEIDTNRNITKNGILYSPNLYRGYNVIYDEDTHYQNKIDINSKKIINSFGEQVVVKRSLIRFSCSRKNEEDQKKFEKDLKENSKDYTTEIYLEVSGPDKNIKIKGQDLTGKGRGCNFGISKPLYLSLFDLEEIPNHNFLSNNKEKLELVVVDDALVWKKVGIAFLKLKAAAKKEVDIDIRLGSGYRPAYGKSSKIISSKGREIQVTTQESIRENTGRWDMEVRNKYKSDYDFIMHAPSSAYNPNTAPPGQSEHGNGLALDLDIGSRKAKNFPPLKIKEYTWLINNSFRFGFVRRVRSEEWHFEYMPEADNPFFCIEGTNSNLFYKDLKLDAANIKYNKKKEFPDFIKES